MTSEVEDCHISTDKWRNSDRLKRDTLVTTVSLGYFLHLNQFIDIHQSRYNFPIRIKPQAIQAMQLTGPQSPTAHSFDQNAPWISNVSTCLTSFLGLTKKIACGLHSVSNVHNGPNSV